MTTSFGQQVLVDPDLDRRLRSEGFVIVPILSAVEIDQLRTDQAELQGNDPRGLIIDFIEPDRSAMRATAELLAPVWTDHLPRIFVDHQPVISTFIVKHPQERSRMLLHCEPTYVDGPADVFNVWIPLVDVDRSRRNGVLRLVLGSERLPFGLMGFNTPVVFRPFEAALEQMSVGIDVPAGHGVIYNSSMLHWSEDNLSDVDRPAIAAAIAPRSAPMIHVVATGRSGRDIYTVDHEFFIDLHPGEVPDRIGERYSAIRHDVDDARLTGATLAATMGLAEPPAPCTVPEGKGLSEDPSGSAAGVLRVVECQIDVGEDLCVEASDLDAAGGSHTLTMQSGSSALGRADAFKLAPEVSARIAALMAQAEVAGDLLVLDPGSSAVLTPPIEQLLTTLEAPRVNAGVRVGPDGANLEPGSQVQLSMSEPVHVWNAGPGSLVAVLSPVERPAATG